MTDSVPEDIIDELRDPRTCTVEAIRIALAELASDEFVTDGEAAHGFEDQLRDAVLQAIAEGAGSPHLLAAEIRKTADVDFDRWYA